MLYTTQILLWYSGIRFTLVSKKLLKKQKKNMIDDALIVIGINDLRSQNFTPDFSSISVFKLDIFSFQKHSDACQV